MATESCPKCGTTHDDCVEDVSPWHLHNLARCRDVLQGQLDAERKAHWVTENESLDAKCVRLVTEHSKAMAEVTRQRDEAIRSAITAWESAIRVDLACGRVRGQILDEARAALEALRHGK